jgi:O-antigen/teichoic acid export membrane protein
MRLWVGEQNYGGGTLTLLFAAILITRVLNQTASIVIIGTGRLKGVVYMSLAEAVVNLVLSLWLVSVYGIIGVAVGTVLAGALTSNWYVILVVCRELRLTALEYLARGPVPALLAGLVTGSIALALVRWYPVTGWVRLFVAGAATGTCYLIAYALIGLRDADRRLLYSRIRMTGRAIQTRLQEAL